MFDLPSQRYGAAESREMRGLNGENTSFDLGFEVYGEKQFTPLLGLQLAFRYGSMTGSNEVEYYHNKFYGANIDGLFLLSNMDLFRTQSPWNFYAKAGIGHGMYSTQQYLAKDDAPDGLIEDKYWESHVGGGVQYELNNQLRLELEASYNMVFTDAFDGYDYGTGSDTYLSTAIGIAYTFGDKEAKPMYATGFFGESYVGVNENNNEELEAKTAAAQAEIEDLKSRLEEQQGKLEQKQQELEEQKREIASIKEQLHTSKGSFNVYFEFDSSRLSEQAKMKLTEELDPLIQQKLELVAYADNNGSNTYNQRLKEMRAESVKQFLVDLLGFEASAISISLGTAEDKAFENQFLDRKVVIRY